MPVSEAPSFQPIFQVYGTKRKAEHTQLSLPYDNSDVTFGSEKRICLSDGRVNDMVTAASPHVEISQELGMDVQSGDQEIYTGRIPVSRQLEEVVALHGERIPSPYPSRNAFTAAHKPGSDHLQHKPSTFPQVRNNIMDLNDEIYNTYANGASGIGLASGGASGMEGVSGMDASCDMNQQHYPTGISTSDAINHIVGCEERNTSGIVRCFCRPTWDGCLAAKHYVSDYY